MISDLNRFNWVRSLKPRIIRPLYSIIFCQNIYLRPIIHSNPISYRYKKESAPILVRWLTNSQKLWSKAKECFITLVMISIWEILNRTGLKARAFIYIALEKDTKETFDKTKNAVKALTIMSMEIHTQVIIFFPILNLSVLFSQFYF